jgi:hypothetical protein
MITWRLMADLRERRLGSLGHGFIAEQVVRHARFGALVFDSS